MGVMKIFEENFHSLIKDNITAVLLNTDNQQDKETAIIDDWNSTNPNNLSCSYCRIEFTNGVQQREHYKLDWHRYNLKQSLLSKLPVTENEFNEKTQEDDISSISGSDSEEKEDTTYKTSNGKLFLKNHEGKVFSIYSCLLLGKKEEITDTILLNRLKECCINNQQWTILMLGGGHFAGAVFNGDNPIVHKTFHCYTVRAGQGSAQTSRDNKSSSQPKSAGASLRRYNEQALVQHVRNIIEAWKTEIINSSLIVYRASGPYNRAVLFGGNQPLLEKSDKRLRPIPFSTRRATFAEVKRVHATLSIVQVYNNLQLATETSVAEKTTKRNQIRSSCVVNRSKSREVIERPNPVDLVLSSTENSNSDDNNQDLVIEELEISFEDDLQIFSDTLTEEQRQKVSTKNKKKKKKVKKSKTKKLKEKEARKKEIIDVLCSGNLEELKELLENVNEILDDNANTLLHLAAIKGCNEIVLFLLENEANPCLKNDKQQTAYSVTQNKEIREIFKQFAKENPDKFNYNKAQIPVNTLTQEELSEKRKVQRKIKKDKEKLKKEENEIIRQEQSDKDRFLKLSDREKRALAAERRILSQSGSVTARCFLCALDISGKIPFEYLGNRFCSIDCLKAHRMQNPIVLS